MVISATKIEREIKHRELCNHSSYLHKILNILFPSVPTLKGQDLGGRLKIFSKIASQKFFDLSDRENIEYFKKCGITSRSGKKKFIDALIGANLVKKNDGILKLTKEGEIIWELLTKYPSLIDGSDLDGSKRNKLSYYEYYNHRIETDGEDTCIILREYCLRYTEDQPINCLKFTAVSDTPCFKKFKLIRYSPTIKKYRVLLDSSTERVFAVYFKKPIQKGDTVDFWFEYEWPGMFLNSWPIWDFSVWEKYPVKYFCIRFVLPEDRRILKKSIILSKTPLREQSKNIGKLIMFDPIVSEYSRSKEVIWRMFVPSHVRFKLSWKHE